jgi:hypothetical protein
MRTNAARAMAEKKLVKFKGYLRAASAAVPPLQRASGRGIFGRI